LAVIEKSIRLVGSKGEKEVKALDFENDEVIIDPRVTKLRLGQVFLNKFKKLEVR